MGLQKAVFTSLLYILTVYKSLLFSVKLGSEPVPKFQIKYDTSKKTEKKIFLS